MRHRLLWLYCFACPWFYGILTSNGNPLAFSDLLLIVMAVLVFTLPLGRRNMAPVLLLLAYALAAVASTVPFVGTSVFGPAFLKSLRLCGVALPPMLLAESYDLNKLRSCVRAFFWGGLISIVYGLVAFYFQWDFGTAIQKYYFGGLYLNRAGGVFKDSGAYGHLLASWTLIVLAFPAASKRDWIRKGVVICIAPLGLYASLSRAAILNIAVGVTVLILMSKWKRAASKVAMSALLACLVLVVFSLAAPDKFDEMTGAMSTPIDRLTQTVQSTFAGSEAANRTMGGRLTSWDTAFQMWMEYPVLGIGYKGLVPLYGMYGDNAFVLALVETGIIGTLCLLGAFAAFVKAGICAVRGGNPLGAYLLVIWAGQLAHCMYADTTTFPGSMTPVYIISAFTVIVVAPRVNVAFSPDILSQRFAGPAAARPVLSA